MSFVPYCGHSPIPGEVAWNLDPLLIGALGAGALVYFGMRERTPARLDGRARLFVAGWLILVLALISPLCNLSVALFSARVVQHMVLTVVAAPLIAAGMLSKADRPITGGAAVWLGCAVFAGVLWLWHSPAAYDESLRNNVLYWLMQVSLIVSAIFLWNATLHSGAFAAFLAVSATGLQMSLLGAVLTFARNPLFSVHQFTTAPWGLTPVEDQQLGGLLMWIPAGLLLTTYSVIALGIALSRMDVVPRKLRDSPSPGLESATA